MPQGKTDLGPKDHGQYAGQGVCCGVSIASGVFLVFYYPTMSIMLH